MRTRSVLPAARFDIAAFGELVADPSRVAMLLALMDGAHRPASELARIAAVSASTASSHLRRLAEGGLVLVEPIGRHRYFRLASEEVADALEALALVRPPRQAASSTLAEARTCYRHLAGRLGVAWFAALERHRLVAMHDGALALTRRGVDTFERLGVSTRAQGKPCLDWTERRFHLGGPLGGALTEHLFAMKWIARRRDTRGVRVTVTGQAELARQFGVRAT